MSISENSSIVVHFTRLLDTSITSNAALTVPAPITTEPTNRGAFGTTGGFWRPGNGTKIRGLLIGTDANDETIASVLIYGVSRVISDSSIWLPVYLGGLNTCILGSATTGATDEFVADTMAVNTGSHASLVVNNGTPTLANTRSSFEFSHLGYEFYLFLMQRTTAASVNLMLAAY